jgi:hypothetical protein
VVYILVDIMFDNVLLLTTPPTFVIPLMAIVAQAICVQHTPQYTMDMTVLRMLHHNEVIHTQYPKPVLQLIFQKAAQGPRESLAFVAGLRLVCKWASYDPVLRDAMWRTEGIQCADYAWNHMQDQIIERDKLHVRYFTDPMVRSKKKKRLILHLTRMEPVHTSGVICFIRAEELSFKICFMAPTHCRCELYHVMDRAFLKGQFGTKDTENGLMLRRLNFKLIQ